MAALKRFFAELLSVNLKDYGEIETDLNISYILLFLSLGVCVAVVINNLLSSASVSLLRALLRHEAEGEGNAKTLAELGLEKSPILRYALASNLKLCRLVSAVDEKKLSYDEFIALSKKEQRRYGAKREVSSSPLFISAEKKAQAENALHAEASIGATLISCLLVLAVCFLLLLALPTLLSFFLGAKV